MVYIYVLQLEHGKFYVGKTTNPDFRLKDHFESNGSAWTKLHNPIKVVEIIPNCDYYDENKYTAQYMDKYGIDNVRGGSFVKIELDTNTIDLLKQLNYGTNDKCFICGDNSHFSVDCPTIIQKETVKDEIVDEIEKLKHKISELENIKREKENVKRQKEIEEENAKKLTFEYYFQHLFDFIQMKKEQEISKNNEQCCSSYENRRALRAREENKQLVPALESIYSSLDIINTRLMKLEDAYIRYTQSK
jgi:hypothetical protein